MNERFLTVEYSISGTVVRRQMTQLELAALILEEGVILLAVNRCPAGHYHRGHKIDQ